MGSKLAAETAFHPGNVSQVLKYTKPAEWAEIKDWDGPQVLLLNFPCSVCYQWVIILTLLQLAMPRNGVAIHRYPESYAYVHTDVDVGQKRYVNVCTYINAHVNIYVNIWYCDFCNIHSFDVGHLCILCICEYRRLKRAQGFTWW